MIERFKHIKKIPILIGIASFFLIGTLIAYASFTTQHVKSNDLRVGLVRGDIDEDFTATTEVGDETKKVVKVTNNGNLPLFVRVMIFPEISTDEGLLLASTIGEQVSLDIGSDWSNGNDGYYYYNKSLPAGEKTSPLIEKVVIDSSKTDSDYSGASLNISVKSEAVSTSDYAYRETWWGTINAPTTTELQAVDSLLDLEKD